MANFEITYDFVIPLLGLVARRFAGWCGSRRQSDASASGDLSQLGDWRLEAESFESVSFGFFVFAFGDRHSLPIFEKSVERMLDIRCEAFPYGKRRHIFYCSSINFQVFVLRISQIPFHHD